MRDGSATAPSGRAIWEAVRDELRLNLYALPFSTLAPAVYHVYLHPADYAQIEGIAPLLIDQIRRALSEEVERLNRGSASRVRGVLARLLEREVPAPIDVPAGGWTIHLKADADQELLPGQIGIVSVLAMPAPAEYEGTPTTRIVRSRVDGTGRVSSVVVESAENQAPASVAAALPIAPSPQTARETDTRALRDRARLTYTDDQGPHTFVMRKDVIAIGRGGSAAWVDVQVVAGSRVSREHLRIRVDEHGAFFVQDVSLWGTTVDGAPVPPAVKGPEGVAQPGPEWPLPDRARIGLADVLVIDFEAIRP